MPLKLPKLEILEVKNLAVVYMSPQHAKVFAAALINNIQKYEKLFGLISTVDESSIEIEMEELTSEK